MADLIPMKKFDEIELQSGMIFYYPNNAKLTINSVDGQNINATYTHAAINETKDITLSDSGYIIGREKDGTNWQLKGDIPSVSKFQAELFMRDGKTIYRNRGSNPIHREDPVAPNKDTAVDIPVLPPEFVIHDGGAGHGYSDVGNDPKYHPNNEDRGVACAVPQISDNDAPAFLRNIMETANKRSERLAAGSTLSIGMKTSDGHYAYASIGDAPVFLVGEKDGEVVLKQISVPHNIVGEMAHGTFEQNPENMSLQALLDKYEEKVSELTKIYGALSKDNRIFRGLGRMNSGESVYRGGPDVFVVKPEELMPDYAVKGLLICSDGIEKWVKNVGNRVPDTIKPFLDNGPEAFSKKIVTEAAATAKDNVTAMMLPADGQGLIAAADGNSGSAVVADAAIECVREACRGQAKQVGGGGGGGPFSQRFQQRHESRSI